MLIITVSSILVVVPCPVKKGIVCICWNICPVPAVRVITVGIAGRDSINITCQEKVIYVVLVFQVLEKMPDLLGAVVPCEILVDRIRGENLGLDSLLGLPLCQGLEGFHVGWVGDDGINQGVDDEGGCLVVVSDCEANRSPICPVGRRDLYLLSIHYLVTERCLFHQLTTGGCDVEPSLSVCENIVGAFVRIPYLFGLGT